ncbi:hypothetical protein, partial [Novosphingobium sp. LASN5T]|uniref:hypothetical protein n=1 Tax=Novosphingobium sp. LASN5T TaxID=2491021 RepID=UPI001CC20782
YAIILGLCGVGCLVSVGGVVGGGVLEWMFGVLLVVVFVSGIWGFLGGMKEKCKMRLTGVSGVHIWRFTDAVLPAFTGFFAASVANIDGQSVPR